MKRQTTAIVVVVAAVAFLLLARIHMARPKTEVERMAKNGSVAPDFELQSLDGKYIRLSDYRGKAVLLNFWATWCGPCKLEIPWWIDVQNEYVSKGLQVIGVAMDDSGKEAIVKFAEQLGVNYPVLIGTETVGDAFRLGWNLPTTYFIDRQGRVVERVFGLVKGRVIYENVDRLLGVGARACPANTKELSR